MFSRLLHGHKNKKQFTSISQLVFFEHNRVDVLPFRVRADAAQRSCFVHVRSCLCWLHIIGVVIFVKVFEEGIRVCVNDNIVRSLCHCRSDTQSAGRGSNEDDTGEWRLRFPLCTCETFASLAYRAVNEWHLRTHMTRCFSCSSICCVIDFHVSLDRGLSKGHMFCWKESLL